MVIKAYAALEKGGRLTPFEYSPGPLGDEEVEIQVLYCGICHSDLSMIDNDWGETVYPLVPGHEVVGEVVGVGPAVRKLKVGDRVGVGWQAGSCGACRPCLGGDQNLCSHSQATIVGHHGGFADRVRCHWQFAFPIPDVLDPEKAGPLFCGGITVFSPILEFGVKPTDRVGVVGIGGLGHLALQFLNKWGCEVVAFTSSDAKRQEAERLGAHAVVNSRDTAAMESLAGTFQFILVTVNVPLDWGRYIRALAPKGRLHFVGAVLEPVPVFVPELIGGQKQISASPIGSPVAVARMLDFCALHRIAPVIEKFPMSRVNDALDHLRSGKARYRVVLYNDFGA